MATFGERLWGAAESIALNMHCKQDAMRGIFAESLVAIVHGTDDARLSVAWAGTCNSVVP